MPVLDSSVLASISDNAPNPGKAQGQAYTLASLINEQQMGKMKLDQQKSEEADKGKIKDLLGKSDTSTFEGQTKAAEAALKINPKMGMELQRSFAERQSQKYDQETDEIRNAAIQQDHVALALDNILGEADTLRKGGATDAMVNATLMRSVLGAKEGLMKEKLPNGQPVWTPDFDKILAAGPLTYDRIKQMEEHSNKGQELLKARLAERGQAVKERQEDVRLKQEGERERHDRATEATAAKRAQAVIDGGFSGQSGQLMAALSERDVALPAGLRSKAQQKATLDGLIARHPDKSVDEIADMVKSGKLTMAAEKTEASVLGRREAAILPVEKSITKPGGFLDQAERAVNAIDFPTLKAAGEFSKWTKEQESDPKLSAYKAAVAELRAEYSIVLSKGGQVTDAARHESEKVIPDLITKEQFKSIRNTVKQGIEASKSGVEESIAGVTGGPSGNAAAPAAGKTVNWADLK